QVLAVLLDLLGPDPGDAQQLRPPLRFVLGDELEGRVAEDDEGWHLVYGGPGLAPGPQLLVQALVVGGRPEVAAAQLLLAGRAAGSFADPAVSSLGRSLLRGPDPGDGLVLAFADQGVEEARTVAVAAPPGVAGVCPAEGEVRAGSGETDVQQA